MKRIYILLPILFLLVPSVSASNEGVNHWWPINGSRTDLGTGGDAFSGGTLNNSNSWNAEYSNGSLTTAGSYGISAMTGFAQADSISGSAWVKNFAGITGNYIFYIGSGAGADEFFVLRHEANGSISLSASCVGEGLQKIEMPSGEGGWNMYSLVMDNPSNVLEFWVNTTNIANRTCSNNAGDYDEDVVGNSLGAGIDNILLQNVIWTPTQLSNLFDHGTLNITAGPASPTISFVTPTPANNTRIQDLVVNASMTNTTTFSNITIELYNTSGLVTSNFSIENPAYYNFSAQGLGDGIYYFNATGWQSDNQFAMSENRTVILDTTPPHGVTNLNNTLSTLSSVTWNWTAPLDPDLNDSLIYINGTLITTANITSYVYTTFNCSTDYNIIINTRDTSGLINNTNISALGSTLNCLDLSTGLQLYYEFNDIEGGPYFDSTNNGWTGYATGTPLRVSGLQGFAVGFDGSANVYINSTMNLSVLNGTSFSIQDWVNFDAFKTNGNDIWAAKTDTGAGISLYYNNTAQSINLEMYNETGSLCTSTNASFAASTGTWNHFIFSFDGTQGALFVNGNLSLITDSCPITTFSSQLLINRFDKLSGNSFETDGTTDEFAVWNRSLTLTDAINLYNGGAGRSYTFITGGGAIGPDILFNIGTPNNVTISFTYNETSGNIFYTWNDVAETISGAYFDTFIYNTSGVFLDSRQQSFAFSGTLAYNISPILAFNWSVYSVAYINDSSRVYVYGDQIEVGTLFIEPLTNLANIIPEDEGSILGVFVVLVFACMGLAGRSLVATIILTDVGLLVSRALGLWKISIGFVITAFLMSFIILWMMARTRR